MKYLGFFIYLYQHSDARTAAGCADEVEFAHVCAQDMKSTYRANAVVVVGPPDDTFKDVVSAYIDEGMYVLLYPQGDFYFRNRSLSYVNTIVPQLESYLSWFTPLSDHLIGICVTEENDIWDRDAGDVIQWGVVHPSLVEYWRAIKQMTPTLPLVVAQDGYVPYIQAIAGVSVDARPDVYLTETYFPLNIDGVPQRTPEQWMPFVEERLVNVEAIFGLEGTGHLPLIAGIPQGDLAGSGWEFPLVDGAHYREQVRRGIKCSYQFGWYYVQANTIPYVGIRDRNFNETVIAEALKGAIMSDYYIRYDSFSLSGREEEKMIHIGFTIVDHGLPQGQQDVISLPYAHNIEGIEDTPLVQLRDEMVQAIQERARQWIIRRAKLTQLHDAAQTYIGTETLVTGLP